MNPQLALRGCSFARALFRFNTLSNRQIPPPASLIVLQTRLAGHAKWQNIAKTKSANDANKCKVFSRYIQMVRRAVISGGRQPNPKLNGKLAAVLAEAGKMNVPKATLERAIERAMNVKIINTNVELSGPGGCAIVVRCETDNIALLRRDLKKIGKKFDAFVAQADTLITMFQSRGFIRASCKTRDNRDVDENYAEEAAIHANAEEVSLEVFDDAQEESLSRIWVFQTDAGSLNQCRGELEKTGLNIISCDLDLVPYRAVDFGEDAYEKLLELIQELREHDQVLDVFHNVALPAERQAC